MKKNFRCTACDSERCFETKGAFIKHFAKEHPEQPEILYDAIGETWDDTITRLMKAIWDNHHRANKAESELTAARNQLGPLLQKLNAIVMIMNSK